MVQEVDGYIGWGLEGKSDGEAEGSFLLLNCTKLYIANRLDALGVCFVFL